MPLRRFVPPGLVASDWKLRPQVIYNLSNGLALSGLEIEVALRYILSLPAGGSSGEKLTPRKARNTFHDKEVKGHPLTPKQRIFLRGQKVGARRSNLTRPL